MDIANHLMSIEDLRVSFPARVILKDISFSIKKGEILGLMGPSGCGKTLTAMTVMGMACHIGASVDKGKVIYNEPEGRGYIDLLLLSEPELARIRGREIAFVAQNPVSALNPVVTVGRQLEQTLLYYQRSDHIKPIKKEDMINTEIDQILDLCGLGEIPGIKDKYPHQLSTGMCQRVAIALGICGKPRLLIADEPTSSLDFDNKDWVLGELKKLRNALSMSILLITHDRYACEMTADRIIYMEQGSVGGIL